MSDKKSWLIALAGVAVGIVVASLYSSSTTEQPVVKIEEEKKPEDDLNMQKSRTFTMKKVDMLKKASLKFEDGLLSHGAIAISRVPHLAETHDCDIYTSPLLGDPSKRDALGGDRGGFLPDEAFSSCHKFILAGRSYQCYADIARELKFLRAGPRKQIFFNPSHVKAAIVTCGGLCPGLNVVIREIVMSLWYNYGVRDIFGVKWGYRGFHKAEYFINLTPSDVKDIHNDGGTMLGSSRGGFDNKIIINACKERGINQLYIIGGDGTHKGIYNLYEYATENMDKIAICGIPKTIDNDIPIIDKSFGFDTACGVAEHIIESANCEAESAEYGVGLVKVMGRDSGSIAAFATLASRDVNICLIPESPFEIEGPYGLCETVCKRLLSKGHCLIVIAEGADDAVLDAEFQKSKNIDAGGHKKHFDIGAYLRDRITQYGKEMHNIEITLKYIDPTYTIRSVPANAGDTVMCTKLAQNAVHAAMAGYTGYSIGHVKDVDAIIPIKCITESAKRKIDITERTWQRVLASTGQPQMVSPENMYLVKEKTAAVKHEIREKYQALVDDQTMMASVIMDAFDCDKDRNDSDHE